MLILVDENIPHAGRLFSRLGSVKTMSGRQITPEQVRDAELLMVRSVTKVNEALLAGSAVRFVGTATIGTEHVDQSYLSSRGIGFTSAPGSNAESVAQYIAAALVYTAGQLGRPLAGCSLGIVGVGHCGTRVERIARALGMEVRLNDPPLARATGDPKYRPLEELLDCDFITLHIPMIRSGADATWRLFSADVLGRVKDGAVVINACRGGVVDEAALETHLDSGRLRAILDVWENEPKINARLLSKVILGTPHIAGYSYDGKVCGARMIYEASCRFLGGDPGSIDLAMPPHSLPTLELDAKGRSMDSVLGELILTGYPIWRDSADLRCAASPDPEQMGSGFDARRKLYPLRREFEAIRATLKNAPADWLARARTIGFDVAE